MDTSRGDVWDWFDLDPTATRRQKAGEEGFVELFVSRSALRNSDVAERRDQVVRRLVNLEFEEIIPGFQVWDKAWDPHISQSHRTNRGGWMKGAFERYDRFSRAANRLGRTLYPAFQEDISFDSPEGKSGSYTRFPDLFLAVQHDRVEYAYVFPHYTTNRAYSIDDYLTALEDGTQWNTPSSQSGLQFADRTDHGVLKAYILDNSTELFGPEWQFHQDEKAVRSPDESSTGYADLVFATDGKRLLVEVKTNREVVNEAFGQLRSYAIRYIDSHDIDEDDLEMVIAAPQFYEYHYQMAEEWGLTLQTVPI